MSLLSANIFSNILYIILAIVVLLTMVLIHELGHYIAGRILKFKIEEFSVGFGKVIFQKVNKRGEKISLRLFPLGGYCAFYGENEDDEEEPKKDKKKKQKEAKENLDSVVVVDKNGNEQEVKTDDNIDDTKNDEKTEIDEKTETKKEIKEETKKEDKKTWTLDDMDTSLEIDKNKVLNKKNKGLTFNEQKPWKRIIVYSAGVFFNFISIFIFSFILLISYGYDVQKVASLDTSYAYLYTDSVTGESLQVNDVIIAVNGEEVNFATNGTLPALLQKAGVDKDITLTIKRNNEEKKLNIKIKEETKTVDGKEQKVRVSGFKTTSYVYGFFEGLGRCFVLGIGFVWAIMKGFWQIISGQVPLSQLGGPISTIGMISTISQSGMANFLVLLPLLAANLAVFNFLPLPALDGAHVIFTTIEWIIGRPINRKVENYIHFFGLIILLAFVFIIDIVHLIVA